MIEDPPLLTIRRRFQRPSPADVSVFAGLPTGFVVDALGGSGALAADIKPIASRKSLCGVALTCDAGPADNLALFGAITVAERGDVVIAARHGYIGNAVTGDLLLGIASVRTAEATLDRKVRDGLTVPDFIQSLIDAGRFKDVD
jgi:4-hydroxy-4-methyl-2-oxoglutarate aldolase